MKKRLTFIILRIVVISLAANANYSITRIEPPFWWTGMKDTSLQLMVYGDQISDLRPVIDYHGIIVREIISVQNPNYLFISLDISGKALPGPFDILFQKEGVTEVAYTYHLRERESGSANRKGFDPSDVIYLITPDRFCNGDPQNDDVEGYLELANRMDKDGRHGGDLQGVIDHLDYVADMGFTALWLNPVLENNMPRTSYHGYAITDFYKVDERFGSNDLYRQLGRKAAGMGIKLIMDMVANHCGAEHWWMKDLPSDDWIHGGGIFISTNHRRTTVQDPYVSPSDKRLFPDGWFVRAMPDMNQQNALLATYLIQNSIWWIEFAGLAGIRQDTYSYPDKDFMASWTCRIMDEYPDFSIVGEEWSTNPGIVSYWQRGKQNHDIYTSCLGSLMDFPLQDALVKGLNEDDRIHSDGLIRMYEMLANDFQYADPFNLVIFPDNHDMSRFFTQVNENLDLFRMGMAYIMTMRGIPQIFYGTEILMKNPGTTDHGTIRSDFPGGWGTDTVNAFTGKGLSHDQAEAQKMLQHILNWRKGKSCIHHGRLIHYAPQEGVYVYFRHDEQDTIMTILNKNTDEITLDMARFSEITGNLTAGKDILTNTTYTLDHFHIPARGVMILELK